MSENFKQFATTFDFEHRTSSPYNSKSSGKAESAIKTAKSVLRKNKDGDALLNYRNAPSQSTGTSPAQRFFNRRTRTLLPTCETQLKPKLSLESDIQKLHSNQKKQKKDFDRRAKDLPPLEEGDAVVMQSHTHGKKKWSRATVISGSGRSYNAEAEDGAIYLRNRVHLKKTADQAPAPQPGSSQPTSMAQSFVSHGGDRPVHPAGDSPVHPAGDSPVCPAGDSPVHPAGDSPVHPAGDSPVHPAGDSPVCPAGDSPVHPAGDRPVHPAGDSPVHPAGDSPVCPAGDSPVHPAGDSPVCPAGDSPVCPAGDSPVHTAGDSPVCPAGDSPVHPASDSPVHPAGDSPVHPAVDSPVHPAGDSPVHPAGDSPVHTAGDSPVCPAGDRPVCPAGDSPVHPAGDRPVHPAGDRPVCPAGDRPVCPAGDSPVCPAGDSPVHPAGDSPVHPAGDSPVHPADDSPVHPAGDCPHRTLAPAVTLRAASPPDRSSPDGPKTSPSQKTRTGSTSPASPSRIPIRTWSGREIRHNQKKDFVYWRTFRFRLSFYFAFDVILYLPPLCKKWRML